MQIPDAERDELMATRIQEALEHSPDGDLAVVLHWLAPVFEELFALPVLDPAEKRVLAAFHKAVEASAGPVWFSLPASFDQAVELALGACYQAAVADYAAEAAAERETEEASPVDDSDLKLKLTSITAQLVAQKQAARVARVARVAAPALSERMHRRDKRQRTRDLFALARAKRLEFAMSRPMV
jgi:hypothetical protein